MTLEAESTDAHNQDIILLQPTHSFSHLNRTYEQILVNTTLGEKKNQHPGGMFYEKYTVVLYNSTIS